MKRNSLSGWKHVYSFTVIQTLKSKSYRVSSIIMLFLCLFTLPVVTVITGNKDEGKSHIEKVYIQDNSGLSDQLFSPAIEDEDFAHITFEPLKGSYDEMETKIDEFEQTSILLSINVSLGGYTLDFVDASNGPVTKSEMTALGTLIEEQFLQFKEAAVGIDKEQIDFLNSEVKTNVVYTDVNGASVVEEDTKISISEYWFIYGLLFVVLMVTTLGGTQIATAIASDKSTRVVEYLLTTVRPMAMMVGKILAMLTAVFGQILAMIGCLFISDTISRNLLNDGTESMIAKYLSPEIFANVNIMNVLISLIVFALGLAFYGTLAGIAGATVSKIEELNEGMTLFTAIDMIGVYIALTASQVLMNAGVNGFTQFALLFPLSSPFLLPGALFIGKISPIMALGAITLQLIVVALLLKFVAQIYESLILHNGSTITPKKLLGMMKTSAKEEK